MDYKLILTMIEDYISQFEGEVRSRLEKVRDTIEDCLPDSIEKTLSYGMPTYKLDGKNLIHFAAAKAHIGIYPSPEGVTYFVEKYEGYQSSKGAIQFQNNEPLPLDKLKDLVVHRLDTFDSDTFPMK